MESTLPKIVGSILLSAIILNGIFFLIMFFTRRMVAQAKSWSSTMGTVTLSTIEMRKSGKRGSMQYPVIHYTYQVMGREYEADKIMPGPDTGGSWAHKVVERYPVGAQVMVHYDPNYPSNALLEREMPVYIKWLWVALIMTDLFLCGLGVFLIIVM